MQSARRSRCWSTQPRLRHLQQLGSWCFYNHWTDRTNHPLGLTKCNPSWSSMRMRNRDWIIISYWNDRKTFLGCRRNWSPRVRWISRNRNFLRSWKWCESQAGRLRGEPRQRNYNWKPHPLCQLMPHPQHIRSIWRSLHLMSKQQHTTSRESALLNNTSFNHYSLITFTTICLRSLLIIL